MHTNGGDRWLVMDALHNTYIDEFRSRVKAEESCKARNSTADFFCNKPRFYLQKWDEATNSILQA